MGLLPLRYTEAATLFGETDHAPRKPKHRPHRTPKRAKRNTRNAIAKQSRKRNR